MKKKLLLATLCIAVLGLQSVSFASKRQTAEEEQEYTSQNNEYYVSDQELKVNQDNEEQIEKASFRDRIINSCHFSPSTATKTYIPMSKGEETEE